MTEQRTVHSAQLARRGGFFALLVGCLFALTSPVRAANPDSVTLSVTPGGLLYGVTITSAEVQGYDFSSVPLNLSTISTRPIGVTNSGNVAEYFALSISNTTPDNWSAINSGATAYDQFKLLGHFVTTGSGQPVDTAFDVNADTITANVPSAAAGRYGQAARTNPTSSTDLYLKLFMPPSVLKPGQQSMTLTINGQAN